MKYSAYVAPVAACCNIPIREANRAAWGIVMRDDFYSELMPTALAELVKDVTDIAVSTLTAGPVARNPQLGTVAEKLKSIQLERYRAYPPSFLLDLVGMHKDGKKVGWVTLGKKLGITKAAPIAMVQGGTTSRGEAEKYIKVLVSSCNAKFEPDHASNSRFTSPPTSVQPRRPVRFRWLFRGGVGETATCPRWVRD